MTSIKDRIKILRKEKNLTQDDLAAALGLSRSTIAGYETNKRKPDAETIHKLADYFDVSIDYLMGRVNQRSSNDKIKNALSSDPELAEFWDQLQNRDDLRILFKQTKEMTPEGVKQIIRIIKAIEEEEQERFNS